MATHAAPTPKPTSEVLAERDLRPSPPTESSDRVLRPSPPTGPPTRPPTESSERVLRASPPSESSERVPRASPPSESADRGKGPNRRRVGCSSESYSNRKRRRARDVRRPNLAVAASRSPMSEFLALG